ncbi:MAG: hypothetical protein AAF602_08710 [Myxococcota bacterium]
MRPQVIGGVAVVAIVVGASLWFGAASDDPAEAPAAAAPASSAPGATPGEAGAPSLPREDAPPAPIAPEAADEVPRELKKLVRGNPDPGGWVEEVPEVYDGEAFADQVADLLDQCESEYEMIDVTCDEAPCMVAWVAPTDAEHPAGCGRWAGAFGGSAITKVAFDVDCPDGRRVRAELATPHDALLASVDDPDAWDGGRMAHRAAAYTVSDWCAP